MSDQPEYRQLFSHVLLPVKVSVLIVLDGKNRALDLQPAFKSSLH